MVEFLMLVPLLVATLATLALGFYTLKRSVSVAFAWVSLFLASVFQSSISGLPIGIISAAVAFGVFILLFFVGAFNRSTTFMVPVVLVLVPINYWWVFLPGIFIATIFSLIFVIRALGVNEVKAMAVETSTTVQVDGPVGLPGLVRGHSETNVKVKTVNIFFCFSVGLLVSVVAVLLFH